MKKFEGTKGRKESSPPLPCVWPSLLPGLEMRDRLLNRVLGAAACDASSGEAPRPTGTPQRTRGRYWLRCFVRGQAGRRIPESPGQFSCRPSVSALGSEIFRGLPVSQFDRAICFLDRLFRRVFLQEYIREDRVAAP